MRTNTNNNKGTKNNESDKVDDSSARPTAAPRKKLGIGPPYGHEARRQPKQRQRRRCTEAQQTGGNMRGASTGPRETHGTAGGRGGGPNEDGAARHKGPSVTAAAPTNKTVPTQIPKRTQTVYNDKRATPSKERTDTHRRTEMSGQELHRSMQATLQRMSECPERRGGH